MTNKTTHGGSRPGSGRPPSGRKQITLRLSIATVAKLDRLAPTRIEQAALVDYLVRRMKPDAKWST